MIKRLIKWIVKRFYPEILYVNIYNDRITGYQWMDELIQDPSFDIIRTVIDQAELTKSLGVYKRVYVVTAIKAAATRKGVVIDEKDVNFLVELALQIKKRS